MSNSTIVEEKKSAKPRQNILKLVRSDFFMNYNNDFLKRSKFMSGDSDVSDSEADELKTLELEIKSDFDDVFANERKIDNSLASTISNGSSDVYNESETYKTEFYSAQEDIQEEKVKKIDPEKDLGYR